MIQDEVPRQGISFFHLAVQTLTIVRPLPKETKMANPKKGRLGFNVTPVRMNADETSSGPSADEIATKVLDSADDVVKTIAKEATKLVVAYVVLDTARKIVIEATTKK